MMAFYVEKENSREDFQDGSVNHMTSVVEESHDMIISKMATMSMVVIALALGSAFASDVPVLMWSPERPLSDLPQPSVHDTIPQDTFYDKYLSPLKGENNHVLVAFLQDKLHMNDISKYADVYDINSDGGAFKNIKGLLDEHFSLELPHVKDCHHALDKLRKDFPGTVHDLTPTSNLEDLELSGSQNYLLIVHLYPVADASNVENAIAANDKVVGEVAKQLKKRSIHYTAFYTAKTSEERHKRESSPGRKLLDVPSDFVPGSGTFYNISYENGTLFAFLKSIFVCYYTLPLPNDDSVHWRDCSENFTLDLTEFNGTEASVDWGTNSTLEFSLHFNQNKSAITYNITITIPMKKDFDRWEIGNALLSISNSNNTNQVDKLEMVTPDYDLIINLMYSFRCMEMIYNAKNTSSVPSGYFILGSFQIQPFNVTRGMFSLSQDCGGWFSTAIWMALFPVSISLVILFFGIYMMLSLSTNDRFDDPKGKTIVINAGE